MCSSRASSSAEASRAMQARSAPNTSSHLLPLRRPTVEAPETRHRDGGVSKGRDAGEEGSLMPAVLSSGSSPEFALQCRSHAPLGLFPWSVEQPTWCVSSSAAGGRRCLPAGRCGVPGMLAARSAAPVAGLPGRCNGRCGSGPLPRPCCRLPARPPPHADRCPAVSAAAGAQG